MSEKKKRIPNKTLNDYYKIMFSCLNCNYKFITLIPEGINIKKDKTTRHYYFYLNNDDEIDDMKTWVKCTNCKTVSAANKLITTYGPFTPIEGEEP